MQRSRRLAAIVTAGTGSAHLRIGVLAFGDIGAATQADARG
jgi:hypothetical protein